MSYDPHDELSKLEDLIDKEQSVPVPIASSPVSAPMSPHRRQSFTSPSPPQPVILSHSLPSSMQNYSSRLDGWSGEQGGGGGGFTITPVSRTVPKQTPATQSALTAALRGGGQPRSTNSPPQGDTVGFARRASASVGSTPVSSPPKSAQNVRKGSTPDGAGPATPAGSKGGEKSGKPSNVVIPEKKKLTKAERRAKQEAQRKAKAEKQGKVYVPGGGSAAPADDKKNKKKVRVAKQLDDPKQRKKEEKKRIVARTQSQKQVQLFSHLPQYERETSLSLDIGFSSKEIHPSIIRLGLMYAEHKIDGASARCVAMLTAFKQIIADYHTPPNKRLSRDLDATLRPCIQFLVDCRPLSISMANAIKWAKLHISSIPADMPDSEAKNILIELIDSFLNERVVVAEQVIANYGVSKIQNGDVILTYGCESNVFQTLCQAHDEGREFRVIVIDSRPKFEGQVLLKRLNDHGVKCTYAMTPALSYLMKEATKVLVGAASFLSNGTALAAVGTAAVAMVAHSLNVPVIFACETYKFCERVQLDSIVQNELGDPDELISLGKNRPEFLSDWRDLQELKLLNLVYDLTPIDFISLVITEVGLIPPSSVPVVVREYQRYEESEKIKNWGARLVVDDEDEEEQ